MNAYQRGNRDGLLAFAAWAKAQADLQEREVERVAPAMEGWKNEIQRRAAEQISTNALRQMVAFHYVAREAERMAQALPMDPEEVEPYKPSWVGDSRGYDQARENPPVLVAGVTISVVRSKDGT
jgi:hypothetical protein